VFYFLLFPWSFRHIQGVSFCPSVSERTGVSSRPARTRQPSEIHNSFDRCRRLSLAFPLAEFPFSLVVPPFLPLPRSCYLCPNSELRVPSFLSLRLTRSPLIPHSSFLLSCLPNSGTPTPRSYHSHRPSPASLPRLDLKPSLFYAGERSMLRAQTLPVLSSSTEGSGRRKFLCRMDAFRPICQTSFGILSP